MKRTSVHIAASALLVDIGVSTTINCDASDTESNKNIIEFLSANKMNSGGVKLGRRG